MVRRFPTAAPESSILGEHLKFPSGKIAQNRFLKAALTEMLSIFDPSTPGANGVPTQEIINVYDKWGNGQFGVILTGNVQVSPVSVLLLILKITIFVSGPSGSSRKCNDFQRR